LWYCFELDQWLADCGGSSRGLELPFAAAAWSGGAQGVLQDMQIGLQ